MSLSIYDGENDLSLCDIIMPNVYIRSLLIYDYHIDSLQEAFNVYLHRYCPQAFQCITPNENGVFNEKLGVCKDQQEGKLFSSETRTNESVLKYLDDHCSLEDLFPYSTIPTDTSPLIFLHQISFIDGTILACGCHHQFSDGHGFSLLGQRFSLWFQGHKPDLFDHDRSKLRRLTDVLSIQFHHSEMSLEEPVYSREAEFFPTDTIVKRYKKEDLFDKLQIRSRNLSRDDVLVGWLTQLISRIRGISLEKTVHVGMAMNGRMLLDNIDQNYFGNCSFYICFAFLMSDLNNLTVDQLAQQIHLEKRKVMTHEYIQSALAFIAEHHQSSTIHLGWEPSGGIDLSFTNWSRFPLYECDFGQGKVKSFKIPTIKSDGLIFILPTPTENEIELHIALKHQHARALLNEHA